MKLITIVGIICLLANQAIAAPVVSPSTASASMVASASVDFNGNVTSQDGDWVSSVSVSNGGRYDMTIKPKTFVGPPRCTANPSGFPVPGTSITINTSPNEVVLIISASNGQGGFNLTPSSYYIICEGDAPRTVFRLSSITLAPGTGNQNGQGNGNAGN